MRDIALVASYPRSGNSWTRVMLACYLTAGPIRSRDTLDDLVPDLHQLLSGGSLLPPDDLRPAIVKTHFPPRAEVHQPYRPFARKILYLVRNPRDIVFSYMRLLHIEGGYRRQFAKDFIANRGGTNIHKQLGIWPQHVRDWTSPDGIHECFPNVTGIQVIKYEDMRADPARQLRLILEFLDIDDKVEPDRLGIALENSSLEKMRAMEEVERRSGPNMYRDRPAPVRFIHQGLTGQSLASLGEDVEAAYQHLLRDDEEFSRCVKRFGYAG
jgi:hypothetical protein